MKILYYFESKSKQGGVANVAYYIPRALTKKLNVVYFPRTKSIRNVSDLLGVFGKFVLKEFDIVHFNYVPTWINGSYVFLKSAKRIGIPTVLNIHGIIPFEHKINPELGPVSWYDLLLASSSCQLSDKIIANTEFMRKKIATWYGVTLDKIVVIPNGIDLREFNECEDTIALDGNPAILTVTWCSRIKGFDILVDAIAKLRSELPNMKLHVLGGNREGNLPLLKEKGIEKYVVFHGLVEHSMVPRYYRSADIFVISSRHEGFPIALLEAMASGVPVIASNIGSLQEIITNGVNGMLFKSEDTVALSKTILTLFQDEDLRKKIITNAIETAKKYSWENVAQKYISLYKSIRC